MFTRRHFIQSSALATSALLSGGSTNNPVAEAGSATESSPTQNSPPAPKPLLTPADSFRDVSRGNPKPYTLTGDALVQARLTPEAWRLEITADLFTSEDVKEPAVVPKQFLLSDQTALDLPQLMQLGEKVGVRYLKAVQCLNIPEPLGQGLWEGVPLRDLLRLCGELENVRRIYYHGFHNNDPKQLFRSSLSYAQVMENAPGDPPVFLAYKLNGEPISLVRGGPVRLIVPWAYGFKSIKWLQQISLTNDYRLNDTYATQNNDADSPMKTAAYFDKLPKKFAAGQTIYLTGQVISGYSGLNHVEYWLHRIEEGAPPVVYNDPVYQAATWTGCELELEPADWSSVLPKGVSPAEVHGINRCTKKANVWPIRYGMASWRAALKDLKPGIYEFRVRSVDRNGFAQPEPRPILKAGRNAVEVHRFEVSEAQ